MKQGRLTETIHDAVNAPSTKGEQRHSINDLLLMGRDDRCKLYTDTFTNAQIVLDGFLQSSAFEGFDSDSKHQIAKYFTLSALDPQNEILYRAHLRTGITRTSRSYSPTSPDDEPPIDRFNRIDLKNCSQTYMSDLGRDKNAAWNPEMEIDNSRLSLLYSEHFANAENVLVAFATDPYFTENYPGTPYTPAFMRCFMSAALAPESFSKTLYPQLKETLKANNAEKDCPPKIAVLQVIQKYREDLKPHPRSNPAQILSQ